MAEYNNNNYNAQQNGAADGQNNAGGYQNPGQGTNGVNNNPGEQLSQIVGEIIQTAGTQFGTIVKNVSENLGNSVKEVSRQWNQNEAARRAAQANAAPDNRYAQPNTGYRYSAPKAKFGNAVYKSENVKGGLLLGFGWMFGLMFGITTLVMLILLLTLRYSVFGILTAAFLLFTCIFVACISGGAKKIGRTRRFKKYMKYIGENKVFELKRLAGLTQQTEKFVCQDIKKMIDMGMFDEAYLNSDETNLFLDKDVYNDYITALTRDFEKQARKEAAAPNVQDLIDDGRSFVNEMSQIRARLNEPEICEKIERLENTATKIFDYVQEHPEKEQEIHKFMRYYLPTTLRLLRTYDEMKAQNISGDTINNAMSDIKKALDTIDTAFENLLDGLFESDAMNISADIKVMNTMLMQEGLTDSPINKTE